MTVKPFKRMSDYTTVPDITDRLVVLRDKADRLQAFIDSGYTDVRVLDVKQAAFHAIVVDLAPGDLRHQFDRYFRTLRKTIDTLETRLRLLERRERRAA